jgi:fatty-acid desaturase
MQKLKFNQWHERQLYYSFAWLISCLMCGFLFVAIIEYAGIRSSGMKLIVTLVVLYFVGLGIIALFHKFWSRFSYAQSCASAATCKSCGAYGLFKVKLEVKPIYARCKKCDHQWVIG